MKTQFMHARTIALFLLLVSAAIPSQGSWQKVAQFATTDPSHIPVVNCSFFFDGQHGIVGMDGVNGIYRTSDGGTTWAQSVIPQGYSGLINDIFMSDTLKGWACIEGSAQNKYGLWKTTDGGASWDTVSGSAASASGIYQHGNFVAVADRTNRAGLLLSSDGGQTFSTFTRDFYTGVSFSDDTHGVAVAFHQAMGGSYATSVYTTDGGVTWLPSSGMLTEAWSVYCERGTSNCYAVGERMLSDPGSAGRLHRSTDYGQTWKLASTLDCRTTGHVAGVGQVLYVQCWTTMQFSANPTGLYRSSDRGNTWKPVGGPSNYRDTRFSVAGCRGNIVYAFDEAGGVWKTTDGGDGLLADDNNYRLSITPPDTLIDRYCRPDTGLVILGLATCDSLIVESIHFADPSSPLVTSGAVNLPSFPHLPSGMTIGADTIKVGWNPRLLGSGVHDDSILIRINGHFVSGAHQVDTTAVVYLHSAGLLPFGIPDTLDFGEILDGDTKCLRFTLRNTGTKADGPLPVQIFMQTSDSSIQFSGMYPGPVTNLNPGDTVEVEYCFSPSDTAMHTATYGISDRCFEVHSIVMRGKGLPDPAAVRQYDRIENVSVSPNPVSRDLTILLRSASSSDVVATVTDLLGRSFLEERYHIGEGSNRLQMNLGALAAGRYWLRIGRQIIGFVKE